MHRDAIDHYFLSQPEPNKSCLLALRDLVLAAHNDITLTWKYRMPVFCFNGKMLCYLWTDKKDHSPYLGLVDGAQIKHPALERGSRARMSIIRIDPTANLPVKEIRALMALALLLRTKKAVKKRGTRK
ncbi:MAG: DUF1801 domain-containing protein [Bacteroidia bacterium]|nr:DUF1801 domain-containing protein [Bacteroidia bacterium]